MTDHADRRARIEELLADRALVGLGPREEQELAALLAESNVKDDPSLDLAAASTDLAALGGLEPAPAHLMAKVQADADRYFAAKSAEPRRAVHRQTARIVAEPASSPSPSPSRSSSPSPSGVAPRRRSRVVTFAPWAIAAAFALFAVGSWWTRPRALARIDRPSVLAKEAAPKKSLVAQREELLASGGDVQVLPFTATKDPGGAGASGDVVWSSSAQRGFMRFHALAPNDPAKAQYQLWIFDADRDDTYPVDGGVFDIDASTGDVVVEIVPKIVAHHPKLFAITVERPGGVVVSKREHIVLTASI